MIHWSYDLYREASMCLQSPFSLVQMSWACWVVVSLPYFTIETPKQMFNCSPILLINNQCFPWVCNLNSVVFVNEENYKYKDIVHKSYPCFCLLSVLSSLNIEQDVCRDVESTWCKAFDTLAFLGVSYSWWTINDWRSWPTN